MKLPFQNQSSVESYTLPHTLILLLMGLWKLCMVMAKHNCMAKMPQKQLELDFLEAQMRGSDGGAGASQQEAITDC